ncbi:MAG TPA: VWA domain-containing protein [Vicinamibacterales bacterium]|nr:VWA domain-containing protein [Vicinamibacterales bacterium]
MSTSRIPVLLAPLLISTGLMSAQDPPPSQGGAQATFRGGVNVVRVDVIASDSRGNPVTDLAKEEFEIIEDGRTQTIDLFRQIRIDATVSDSSRPRQVLNRDTEEREASRDDVRIFAIMLADYQVCAERSRLVRDALAGFVDKLGPNDLVAVMSPLMSVRDLLFTYDHDSILRTIQGFEGRKGDYTPRNAIEEEHLNQMRTPEPIRTAVVRDALEALAVRLGSMREGRKSLIFVSEGFPAGWYANPQQLHEITREANRHNTSIYPLDPRGLVAGDGDVAATLRPGCGRIPPSTRLHLTQETLRELADETDGRAIVNRNSLAEGLAQILRDSSLYYLLGYSSTASQTDGKFHPIRVRVKRPKVEIRARKGYWASTADDVSRAATPAPVTPQPILDALGAIAAPNRDGRLVRTFVGIARGVEGKGRVTIVWEPLSTGAGRGEMATRVAVTATRPRGENLFQSAPDDLAPGALHRVSFDVPAGSLELTMTVTDREGNTIDREKRTISVPDYTGAEAALGTPHFYRARTPREFQALAAGADATPIATRDFPRTEHLLIRFDAYTPGSDASVPTAAILSRAGRRMFDVPVARATAGASHQIDLALTPLPAGEYLLEVVAAPDGPRQLAAFRIR